MSLFFYVKVLSENYPCITEEITNYVLWGIVNVLGGQTWTLTIDTASLKCSSKQVICPNLFIGLTEFWCHFYVQLIPRLFFKKSGCLQNYVICIVPPNAHQTCQSILCPDKWVEMGIHLYSFIEEYLARERLIFSRYKVLCPQWLSNKYLMLVE